MKKLFTKVLGTVVLATCMLAGLTVKAQDKVLASVVTKKSEKTDSTSIEKKNIGLTVKAQDQVLASVVAKKSEKTDSTSTEKKNADAKSAKADDASWTPTRRLWGYTFGDLYYAPHVDAGSRGPETMYNGVPSNRNAFQFRRIYLGYDYDIDKKFSAEVLLASEPNANTGVNGTTAIQNGDNLVDNKMGFYIKNFNLRVREIWTGTDLVVGEMSTPGFALNTGNSNAPTSLSEATWGYRFIEKTITDFHKNNSYDVGASLQGTFDPSTKNFGYVFMVGNNSQASLLSAANANTGFYKIFYGDIWAKFLNKKLYVDIYADYAPTAAATATIGGQNHSIKKIFAAYNTKPITIGVEAYTQQLTNGITDGTTKTPLNATANGLSIWAKGNITSKWGWFARYDSYNPDTDYDPAVNYTVNTNYSSYTPAYKETFYTAGFDFQPAPKIHFSPNLWLIDYKDQRATTTAGYVGPDHTLVVRATFYYTFGK